MEEKLTIAVSLNLDLGLMRYTMMYQGIQEYAKKHTNWSLFWDHFPEVKLKKNKNASPAYDGIVGRIKYDAFEEAKRLNIPCVNLWYNSTLTEEIPTVSADYIEAGRLAAKHLLNRGFKNLIFMDYMDKSAKNFLKGLNEVLKPMKYKVRRYRFNRASAETPAAWGKQIEAFDKWVKEWELPVAIVSTGTNVAIPTFCKSNDIRIPEDVAFMMCGAEDNFCETIDPYITSIDTDYWRQGYEAARVLDQLLKGEALEKNHFYINPKGVVARESTDTYATEDEVVRDALRYIADNIDKEIQVADVVEHVPASRSSLEGRFKSATGSTIKDEINRLRVISAKRLLSDKSIKIKDVHQRVGFSSALHLRRVFSKQTGMTPGDFRKNLKTT
jgi:LacI family transcriptional regulator